MQEGEDEEREERKLCQTLGEWRKKLVEVVL